MLAVRTATRPTEPVKRLTLASLFRHSSNYATVMRKEGAIRLERVEPGSSKDIEQPDLFVELFRESFEIAEDDNAGLAIEVNSDFLLAGVHVVLQNTATGTLLEDERHEGTSKLTVGLLAPGHYVLMVYTHKCITNMDQADARVVKAFDVLLDMRVRPLRKVGGRDGELAKAGVPVKISDGSTSTDTDKPDQETTPVLVTAEELDCRREHLPLPDDLDINGVTSQIDWSESFYLPTYAFTSHEMLYTAREGQQALRVFLAKSNCKASILSKEDRKLLAQSRPVDKGRAQLLVATDLVVGSQYLVLLEFSERAGLDGRGGASCDHFVMAVKTGDAATTCMDASSGDDAGRGALTSSLDGEFRSSAIGMKKKTERRLLTIQGSGAVDLQLTLDYSAAFYRADLVLTVVAPSGHPERHRDAAGDEAAVLKLIATETTPTSIDFTRKHATTYLFTNIVAGKYEVSVHQRFKAKTCRSPVTLSYRSWEAGASAVTLERGGLSGLQIYQSQSEEQERPRAASRLPLDLRTYKFTASASSKSTQ